MDANLARLRSDRVDNGVSRRTFLEMNLATGATILAGGSTALFAVEPAMHTTFKIGGDITVNRLGFGAMRITGDGIWGWPPDRNNALKVLRRGVELGVNLIDTADAYGPKRVSS